MANKSIAMLKFTIGLVVLAPIGTVAGFLGLAWFWDYLAGCFFSLSYYCGQDKVFKAIVFIFISGGCFSSIKYLWARTK